MGLCACDVLLCVIMRVSGVVTTSARVLCFALLFPWDQLRAGPKMHRVALLAVRKPNGVLLALPAMSADTRFSELKHIVREQWGIPLSMQRFIVGQSEIWAGDDDTFSTSFGIVDDAEKDVVEVTVLRDVVSEELDAAARAAGMSTELAFHLQRRRAHVVFFDSLFYSVGFSTPIELERALLLIPHDCRDWFMLFDDDSTLRCDSTLRLPEHRFRWRSSVLDTRKCTVPRVAIRDP